MDTLTLATSIAKHTLQRARKRAGIRTHKADFGGGWVWALPPEGDGQGNEDRASSERHLRHLGRHLGSAESADDWIAAADQLLAEDGGA